MEWGSAGEPLAKLLAQHDQERHHGRASVIECPRARNSRGSDRRRLEEARDLHLAVAPDGDPQAKLLHERGEPVARAVAALTPILLLEDGKRRL